jgi:formate-dependent nitrite reductase membrane component NrfD
MTNSYYGKPIVKAPVWGPSIAAYFFAGGLAGASAVLVVAARARGNDVLARRALAGAMLGTLASPVLLISDLRDAKRFHHMLRVFKPTSPMSVGTWILSTFGVAIAASAISEFAGILVPVGRSTEIASGLLGTLLATYTATLIANTAIPIWHDGRRELPFLFAGGSAASGAAFAVIATPVADAAIARRVMLAGVVLEGAAMQLMEARLGSLIFEPYKKGRGNTLRRLAQGLTLAGASLSAIWGSKSRSVAMLAGGCVLAGTACERFSVFYAGFDSANDPKYVVIPQRARVDARERMSV